MKSFTIHRVNVGFLQINDGKVDITDPGYDKDVWCRINDLSVTPGKYRCYFWHGADPDWGERTWKLGIEHVGSRLSSLEWEEIGEIGVDSGQAGFFNHKQDFSDVEWKDLCDAMYSKDNNVALRRKYDVYGSDNGFWSQSGCGDGVYGVFAKKKSNGDIAALEIHF